MGRHWRRVKNAARKVLYTLVCCYTNKRAIHTVSKRGSSKLALKFAYSYGRDMMCYSNKKATRAKGYIICSRAVRHDNELNLGINFKKKGRVLMWAIDRADVITVRMCVHNGEGLILGDYCHRTGFKDDYEYWGDIISCLFQNVSHAWVCNEKVYATVNYMLERLAEESEERLKEIAHQSPLREIGYYMTFPAAQFNHVRFLRLISKYIPLDPVHYKQHITLRNWRYMYCPRPVLSHTIVHGKPVAVKYLLEANHDPDEFEFNNIAGCPMILACQYHKLDIVLQYGINPNVRDKYGNIALSMVMVERYEYIDERSPGVWGGYGEVTVGAFCGTRVNYCAQQLIRYGCDYNIRMSQWFIPALELAMVEMCQCIAEMLLAAGARPWNKEKSDRAIQEANQGSMASVIPTSSVEPEEHDHFGKHRILLLWEGERPFFTAEPVGQTFNLMELSRFSIRKALGYWIPHKVKQLPLPRMLQNYLLIPELEEIYDMYDPITEIQKYMTDIDSYYYRRGCYCHPETKKKKVPTATLR